MNIAILLGVSEYQNADNLPACKKDLEQMVELTRATGKYDNIIHISENTNAANVKEIITSKIKDFKDNEIEEIFFYYTGHGDFYKNEFYYVLSDFDEEKRKQTSLENLEVDNWLRSLKPNMMIKVIDACHAGVVYVKGNDHELKKYLKESKGEFNNCYFMFSSNFNQSSYQDDKLSYFTKSFINAVKMHNAKEIRYKDIIDYISDDFGKISSEQIPFFVTQADFTEKFCSITSNIKNLFAPLEEDTEAEEKVNPPVGMGTLESIIKEDANSYLTKDQALELLEKMKENIEDYEYSDEFRSLYKVNHEFMNYIDNENIPKLDIIGKWLDENDNEYFVEVKVDIKVPNNYLLKLWNISPFNENTEIKRIIKGFNLTVELPYELIKIEANPEYPNMPKSECIIVYLLSRSEIRFFYCFIVYRYINWDEIEIDEEKINWITEAITFGDKENLFNFIFNIQKRFADFIIENLNEKFGIDKAKESTERLKI